MLLSKKISNQLARRSINIFFKNMATITEVDGVKYRVEKDTMGDVSVEASRFWGAQTERSRNNFKIGGERMPVELIRAFAQLKSVAAEVNGELQPNKLKSVWVTAIQKACQDVIDGKLDDHFPLVVWQTGSGTQTNMNLNEVIANRANAYLNEEGKAEDAAINPNDHVNMGQSSNDSFPTAMHIATAKAVQSNLLPALSHLHVALLEKSKEFHGKIKVGRTHMQDATPITLEQEFHAFATQVHLGIQRVESALTRVLVLAQGGTAVGTGINCPAGFKEKFSEKLSQRLGMPFKPAEDLFEALSTHDTMVEMSGQLNVLAVSFMKIANDIRMLGSGPRCGLNEIFLPENEPGSSIMPGKVNPTQAEAMTMVCCQVMGNNTTISIAGSQGHFQLNVFKPVIAFNILQSIRLLSDAATSFTDNCVVGITANEPRLKDNVNKSLMLVTALNPVIGYSNAAKVAKLAMKEDISLKDAALKLNLLTAEEFDKAVVPEKMLGDSFR